MPSLLKLVPAAALLVLSGPAVGLDEIVRSRGWMQVDYVQDAECRAEVRGNGQFYRIAGAGMEPGEEVRIVIRNEDVKPVQYRVVANDDGMWREFYVPFVWHLEGGVVQVDVQSVSCILDLSFAWQRRRL